jgi:hypothetical protein
MLAGHDGSYIQLVWIIASAFGIVALVALVALYRRAARRVDLEHAEAVIAEHDQSLVASSSAGTSPRSTRCQSDPA